MAHFTVILGTMNAKLIGFFSGFPTRRFTDEIADILREELTARDSLVFVSAWPEDFTQSDDDSDGMHGMFAERDMPFAQHHVIDNRTTADEARNLVHCASCIFLMGGNATLQFQLHRGRNTPKQRRDPWRKRRRHEHGKTYS